jgi:hypothetical protein
VADLAGGSADPSPWFPAEDQPCPDAGCDLQVDDVGAALSCTPCPLAQRAEIGVVVDEHRQTEALGHSLLGSDANPAGEDRRRAKLSGRLVNGAGQAHADADDFAAFDTGFVERVVKQVGGDVHALLSRPVGMKFDPLFGQHGAAEIRNCDLQMALAEVDSNCGSGGDGEADQVGTTA